MKAHFYEKWPLAPVVMSEMASQDIMGDVVLAPVTYHAKAGAEYWQYATWAPLNQSTFINQVFEMNVNPAEQASRLEEHFKAAFGAAQRVSELCQRLEKIEAVLLEVVTKLDRSAQPQRSLWVPIESFAPEPYEALKTITAVVTPIEDGFEAGLFEANLFSTGDTEVEAVKNLKSVILETYAALEQLGDSKLGPGPLQQRKILTTLIREARS